MMDVKCIIVLLFENHLPRNLESIISPIHENHEGCPIPAANRIIAKSIKIRKGRIFVAIPFMYRKPINAIISQPKLSINIVTGQNTYQMQ